MMLKLGTLRKLDKNTLKVLKCRAEEGWRSAGPSVWRMKRYYKESEVLHRVRLLKKSKVWQECQKYFAASEELQRVRRMTVRKQRNIPHIIKRRQANWIGHILCISFFLKPRCWRKTEGRRKRWRRRKKLLDELKETRKLWKLRQ